MKEFLEKALRQNVIIEEDIKKYTKNYHWHIEADMMC